MFLSSDDHAASVAPPFFLEDDGPPLPVARRPQPPMTGVVAELAAAPDQATRQAVVKRELRAIGFEWLGYGAFEEHAGMLRPLRFLTSHANENWMRRYFSQGYHRIDTRPQDAPVSSLPLVWDLESIAQSHCRQPMRAEAEASGVAERRRMFLADLEASGVHSGIFFRVATPGQVHEYTVFSLLSVTPGRRWIRDGTVGRALMLGLSLHEHVLRHVPLAVGPEAGDAPHAKSPMSATQRSILESLLRGLGDKEIAHSLGLSGHAVDYHLRQLRRRFGVHNRVQLVSAAAGWQP